LWGKDTDRAVFKYGEGVLEIATQQCPENT
jgi:hypothetical protein